MLDTVDLTSWRQREAGELRSDTRYTGRRMRKMEQKERRRERLERRFMDVGMYRRTCVWLERKIECKGEMSIEDDVRKYSVK